MSRLINNEIWNARSFSNLSVEDKLMFLYLETSPETNYYGVFLLPNDSVISARTGLSIQKVKNSLEELEKKGKVALVGDYLIIFDYFDRQLNNSSEKTRKGLENFEKSLPKEVLDRWLNGKTYPIDTPLIPPTNPHEEIKVNKSKGKEKEIKVKENEILEEIVNFYNLKFSKNFKSLYVIQDNFYFWLETYTKDEILKAVANLHNPKFWANQGDKKADLELLFRRRNKAGNCDYIDQLLELSANENINSPIFPENLKDF